MTHTVRHSWFMSASMGHSPNQSMKPTAHCETTSVCLPRYPVVAYLFLVKQSSALRHEASPQSRDSCRRVSLGIPHGLHSGCSPRGSYTRVGRPGFRWHVCVRRFGTFRCRLRCGCPSADGRGIFLSLVEEKNA